MFRGIGVFKWLQSNPMADVGLFQSYSLMMLAGVILWIGSYQEKPWIWLGSWPTFPLFWLILCSLVYLRALGFPRPFPFMLFYSAGPVHTFRLSLDQTPNPEEIIMLSRKTILRGNAIFLILVGLVQATSELLSHVLSVGSLAGRFVDSRYTIGFFEAHGLAALVAIRMFNTS
jgi:hypothetical protein